MGMGKGRATAALGYLASLFPRWKSTPELNTIWVETLADFDAESVTVILKAHRVERGGNDPNLKDVRTALKAVVSQRMTVAAGGMDRTERPVRPWGLTFSEAASWALENDPPVGDRAREDFARVARGEEPHGEHLRRIVNFRATAASVVQQVAGPVDPKREAVRTRNITRAHEVDSFEAMRTES